MFVMTVQVQTLLRARPRSSTGLLACFLSVSQHGKKYCSVCWGLINIRRSYLRKDCQYVELKGPVTSSKQVLTLHKGANLLAHHSLEGKVQASVCRPPSHPATSWILVWLVRIRVFWEVRVHLKRRPCYGKRRIKCSTASITFSVVSRTIIFEKLTCDWERGVHLYAWCFGYILIGSSPVLYTCPRHRSWVHDASLHWLFQMTCICLLKMMEVL